MPHFTTRILRAELAHRDECIAFGKCAASKWPDSQAGTMAVGTGAVVYMGPGMYVNRAIGLGLEPFDVRHRIAHALSSGSDLVVTSTDPESASERNVIRAGFRPLYVQLTYVRS